MSTDINKIIIKEDSEDGIGGLLKRGDSIDGYVITKKISASSGEAELYICEKNSKEYILKYYYNKTIFSDLEQKLKALNHKNVMKVYSCGKDKKRGGAGNNKRYSYEIDEFCEGESLANSSLPLSEEQAFDILKQVNEGLKAIHDEGIIHRDIKAENIYYKNTSKKEVVIGDFGISIVYDQKDNVNATFTDKDNIPGTDGYKAPDVYDFIVTPAIDYYSLGITLWNLLTGKNPFVDDNGQPFSSEKLEYDTINEKIKDFLLERAPDLSEKAKKVISGLLVYKFDQRWGYDQVKAFLAGKEVPVFEERKDLSPFNFCNKELFTLKAIAEEILKNCNDKENKNYTETVELLEKSKLTRYLDKNDLGESLTPQIEDIMKEYFPADITNPSNDVELKKYGLRKVAFVLYNNLTFSIPFCDSVYEINKSVEFINLLLNHPKAIVPYLKDERLGLYLKLDAIAKENQQKSISSKIQEIVKKTKDENILPFVIYFAITENKLKPFTDKLNSEIELSTQKDYYDLPENLKERLMYKINAKDKMTAAWFENVFGVDMSEWYSELNGGPEQDELISSRRQCRLLIYGSWQYFELFLKGKDVIFRYTCSDKDKKGLTNFDGSILLEPQFDEVAQTFMRNSFIYRSNDLWYLVVKDKHGKYVQKGGTSKEPFKIENEVKSVTGTNLVHSYFYDYSVKARLLKNPELEYICSEAGHPNERFIHYRNNKFYLLTPEQRKRNLESLGSFSNIQNIIAEGIIPENLLFWACRDKQVFLIDKNLQVLENYPYSDFEYVGNNCFIVTSKDGDKKDLVTWKNEIIREDVSEFRGVESSVASNIAAIKRTRSSKWEIINLSKVNIESDLSETSVTRLRFKYVGIIRNSICAFNSGKVIRFFTESNNEVQTATLMAVGNGGILSNSQGLKTWLQAVNHKAIVYAVKNGNTINNLLAFDGKNFVRYNFTTFKVKRFNIWNLSAKESESILSVINRKKLLSAAKKYIAHEEYEKANVLIDSVFVYWDQNRYARDSITLLSLLRMDKTEGLRFGYLYYQHFLAAAYYMENTNMGIVSKKRLLIKQNINYVNALLTYMTAAGKEIDKEGTIISRPGLDEESKKALGWSEEIVLSCAQYCADLVQLYRDIMLPYGWTRESMRIFASCLLYEVLQGCESDPDVVSISSVINRAGKIYLRLGDVKSAIATFEKGVAYDEVGMIHINLLDWLGLLFKDGQKDKAFAGYCTVTDESAKKDIEATLPELVTAYKRHMQEYRR